MLYLYILFIFSTLSFLLFYETTFFFLLFFHAIPVSVYYSKWHKVYVPQLRWILWYYMHDSCYFTMYHKKVNVDGKFLITKNNIYQKDAKWTEGIVFNLRNMVLFLVGSTWTFILSASSFKIKFYESEKISFSFEKVFRDCLIFMLRTWM